MKTLNVNNGQIHTGTYFETNKENGLFVSNDDSELTYWTSMRKLAINNNAISITENEAWSGNYICGIVNKIFYRQADSLNVIGDVFSQTGRIITKLN